MEISQLKSQESNLRSNLKMEQSKLDEYDKRAKDIDELYKKMKKMKLEMKEHRNEIINFSNETYTYWIGDNFNNVYEARIRDELIDNYYREIITQIDNNLDELNRARLNYENKILNSQGIIGNIRASINSVVTEIQNWIN